MVLRRGVREFEVAEMRRDLSAAWLLYIEMLDVASSRLVYTPNRWLRRHSHATQRVENLLCIVHMPVSERPRLAVESAEVSRVKPKLKYITYLLMLFQQASSCGSR